MLSDQNDSAVRKVEHETATEHPDRHAGGLPFAAVIGCLAGICVLATTQTPIRDVDLYWHLIAGRELSSGVPAGSIGTDWSFAPDPRPWTTTQWLAELVLFRLHEVAGWAAMAAVRVATSAVVLGALALTTLRGRPKALAGMPFLVAGAAACLWAQERPQQVTYIGAAFLGGVVVNGLYRAKLPRWWIVVPTTVLWANVHGGWVLTPAVLGVVALGRVLDHNIRDRAARRSVGLAALAFAAGALSPAGLSNLTAAFRVSQAASTLIAEWQGTIPMSAGGAFSVVMLILVAIGWSRPGAVPRSEVASILVFLLFTWAAWRNLAPGLLLMAPLVAHRLCLAFPRFGIRPEPRWSAPLGVAIAAGCTVAALALLPGMDHLPTSAYPLGLVAKVSTLPGNQRVLNAYDVAGLTLYFGGDGTQVAIDGRTDRYGSDYINRYRDALEMKGDWQTTLHDLDPTAALIKEDSGLAEYLVWKGWKDMGRGSGFVLLVE